MSKLRDIMNDPAFKDVTWIWKREEWVNDRVIGGPLSSKKVDKQYERVLLSKDRLDFIFKHGKLIYQHHRDPSEPVLILGDCIAIGTDTVGKTFALWGCAKGSESIDNAWGEMVQAGTSAGFSIGGKRTEKSCKDGVCTLTDPEVTETSWTPQPANDDCTVYYINQFAKSLITKAVAGHNTFEIDKQIKKMNKRLKPRLAVDPYFDVGKMQENYDCARDYVMGMMEMGVKRGEAEVMLKDYLTKISKEVKKMEQESIDTVTIAKLGEQAPEPSEPAQTSTSGGNAVLEQLGAIANLLTTLNTKLDQLVTAGIGGVQAPDDGQEEQIEKEPPEDEDAPEEEEPESEEEGEGGEKEPEADDGESDDEDDEEDKKVKKTDGSLDLPEGENPEPESPNPEDTTDDGEVEDKAEPEPLSEGDNPEPEGAQPDMPDPDTDLGDVDDEGNVTVAGDDDTSIDAKPTEVVVKPEDMAKGLLKKKVEKDDSEKFLKENNFVMVKARNRTKVTPDDPPASMTHEPEKFEKGKSGKTIMDKLKDGLFDISK